MKLVAPAVFDDAGRTDDGARPRRTRCARLEFWKPGRMTRLDARLRRWFPPYEVEDGDERGDRADR